MHKLAVVIMAAVVLALSVSGVSGAPPAHTPVAPAVPAGWQTIMSEDFEGAWPGSKWTVTESNADGSDRYWAPDDFKPYAGVFSAWPASAGTNKVDPEVDVYPNDMDTRMVYGPFDLSDALAAQVEFWLWYEIEAGFDYLYLGVLGDGVNYDGKGWWDDTSQGWELITVDLAPYVGDNSVWVRWDFFSDESIGRAGPFIDNITISKLPLAAPAVTISRSGSTISLIWTADANATGYEVWWGINDPYFTPGTSCPGTNCAVVATPPYPHNNPVSTMDNYTYVVRAVSGNSRSAFGNRVSEFDFALIR